MSTTNVLQVTLAMADLAFALGTLVQASDRADEALGPLLAEVADMRERLANDEITKDEADAFVQRAMAPLDEAIGRL